VKEGIIKAEKSKKKKEEEEEDKDDNGQCGDFSSL
jgi:hypothetical protein